MHWNPDDTWFLTGLLWSLIGFALYYFLSKKAYPSVWLSSKFPMLQLEVSRIMIQRAWGALFLGIIPVLIVHIGLKRDLSEFGLRLQFLQAPPLWSYALVPLIVLVTYATASKPSNLALYPQIRARTWRSGTVWLNAVSWVVFLVAYEFLFRGFLLFCSLSTMTPYSAITLNVVLYAFAHFYKGPSEIFGSIPIGIVLCYLTLVTGNIWCAVAIHSIMALSHEWFSLQAHPQMNLVRK
jgi:membrane protease YdiL (CAAX protease family)